MNLLYLTFGSNTSIHLQAAFSIYSFLSQPTFIHTMNVITDSEDFYNHFGSRVNVIKISEDELTNWKGEQDFFWRIKIKAIEKICLLYPNEPVVYLDTDTFLFNGIDGINNALKIGKALMHENEGFLSGKKSKTERLMWQQIAGKTFGGLQMQPTDCMWNAGLVATPNTKGGSECLLALNICDEMCKQGVTRRLVEQYAISLALENEYRLVEAKDSVAHYWSTKDEWNSFINNFFVKAYFSEWDFEKISTTLKTIDKSSLPVYHKIKSTNLRLKTLIDHFFPTHSAVYLPKK